MIAWQPIMTWQSMVESQLARNDVCQIPVRSLFTADVQDDPQRTAGRSVTDAVAEAAAAIKACQLGNKAAESQALGTCRGPQLVQERQPGGVARGTSSGSKAAAQRKHPHIAGNRATGL